MPLWIFWTGSLMALVEPEYPRAWLIQPELLWAQRQS